MGHGLASGPHYTEAQIRAFQTDAAQEMSQLVQTMNEEITDGGELEELSRDLRVKFKEPRAQVHSLPSRTPRMHDPDSTEVLRKALAATGVSKKKPPPAPTLWFGMIGKQEVKWITLDPITAHAAAAKTYGRIHQVFHTKEEAEEWLDEDEGSEDNRARAPLSEHHGNYDSDSSDASSVAEVKDKKTTKADRRKEKNRTRRALKNKAAKAKKKVPRKEQTKANKRSQKGRGGRSTKRHGRDSSDSDSSNSSEESDSESSESESSVSSSSSSSNNGSSSSSRSSNRSSGKRPRREPKRKSKKGNKKSAKKKKSKDNYHKFQHEDPSTGDPQRVYGMSINSPKIDKAMAPSKMRRSDRGSLYNASVDVTSLPGGWNSNKGVSEELFNESQKIAQLTSTILASTNKVKGMEIQDSTWNSSIRHSLGKVRNREELFEFVRKLRKSKKAAFKQEGNLIQHYLYQRHYEGSYIREYVRSSLLGIISARSFKSFFDLGDAIRQLAYDHPHWEGGPARAMLRFHSEKLMEIRQFSVSRKQLILQMYTYLRDAQAKDFYHESMAGALWERIGDLSHTPSPTNGNGGTTEPTRCGLCGNKDMHKLFNVLGQKTLCPVKDVPRAKAKDAAKWIVDQKRAAPDKDIHSLLSEAKIQFV